MSDPEGAGRGQDGEDNVGSATIYFGDLLLSNGWKLSKQTAEVPFCNAMVLRTLGLPRMFKMLLGGRR